MFACKVSCNSSKQDNTKPVVTNDGVVQVDTLPSWIVANNNIAEGYVSYSSSNIPFDTVAPLNVFPFAVKDTSGNSGMFVLVTLNRYDMLYITALNICDNNDYAITADYVKCISKKEHSESHLFMIRPEDSVFFTNKIETLKFNIWGLFGSICQKLDTTQTANVVYLANMK